MIPIPGTLIWGVAKGFILVAFFLYIIILVAFFLYIIFSLVVVRQVQLMTETLEVGFEAQLKTISYLHLAFAILVFLAALIVL
ncbi:MAG: hypothetical protein UX34_C0032G0002 [Candidatus Woesebacteria bacterium GW2011_GWF1_46_13]|uniref:Uncharacterized protein n=1 Tax=Candidatus Woesebacteria bacterium GW2011_GWF1_46_13 TaxID=1618602 RepID=A0A0G1QWM1_9BACT|nr:MAG: hypothetical protein UX34_C0032G0002 [Candidatus Woesebacteria bacterium GW2011_GWF1_46_13]